MAYCALADIEKLIPASSLIQLTKDAEPYDAVDTDKVDAAIGDAGDLIDGYLRSRYELPLSPVPALLGKLAVDMAVYNLYSRRPEQEMPETVKDRYRDALKLLAAIQEGKISLGTEAGSTPEPGQYKTNKTSESKVFTDEVLDKMS